MVTSMETAYTDSIPEASKSSATSRNLFSGFSQASTSKSEETNSTENKKETDHLKQVPLSGYIHETSPVKPSTRNYSYFNFKLQTANGYVDGISFERSLQNQVKQKEETQKGVKISNYTLKRSLHDDNDMVICISKRSKIENLACAFDHKQPQKFFTKINKIEQVADFSLISVLGKVHVSSEITEVNVQGRSIMKLDCKLGDETGVIKVTLWDKKISLVKDQEIYKFIDIRVRSYQEEKYLSTSLDTTITKVNSNIEVVPELMKEDKSDSDITVTIYQLGGVQEIQRYAVCNNCKRRLSTLQSNMCVCDSCGLNQHKTSADQTHFSLGVLIDKETNNVVRMLQNEVKSFIEQYNKTVASSSAIQVEKATDYEIFQAFLIARNLTITYSPKTKLVSSIVYKK